MRAVVLYGSAQELVAFVKALEGCTAIFSTGEAKACSEGVGDASARQVDKYKGKDFGHDKGKGYYSAIVDQYKGKSKAKGKGKDMFDKGYNSVNADKYFKDKGKGKGNGKGYDSVNADKYYKVKGKGKGEVKGYDSVNADKYIEDKGKDDKDKGKGKVEEAASAKIVSRCSSAVALSPEQLAQSLEDEEEEGDEEMAKDVDVSAKNSGNEDENEASGSLNEDENEALSSDEEEEVRKRVLDSVEKQNKKIREEMQRILMKKGDG